MAHPATRYSTDQIYSVLRSDVISGALKPREAMSEARMAMRFGVSRTPVREAFKRLVDEGFLVAVPQVGTFVAPIDLAAVHDSQFVRETLECRTVVLAAQRIGDADCRRLAAQVEVRRRPCDGGIGPRSSGSTRYSMPRFRASPGIAPSGA